MWKHIQYTKDAPYLNYVAKGLLKCIFCACSGKEEIINNWQQWAEKRKKYIKGTRNKGIQIMKASVLVLF